MIIKYRILLYRFILFVFFSSFIAVGFGQQLVPLSKQALHSAARMSSVAEDTLLLPFFEDFTDTFYRQATIPNPALWQPASGVTVNNSGAVIAPSHNTAIFDGADADGVPYKPENVFNIDTNDVLVSLPINIANAKPNHNLRFTFYWQSAGFAEQPESQDSLFLDFLDTAGNWVRQWQAAGQNTSAFSRQSIDICLQYFSNAFCFRFMNFGRQGGGFDHWHLDYIHIYADTLAASIPAYFDATLTSQPRSLFKKYSAIPKKQLLARDQEALADTIALHMRSLQHLKADTVVHHATLSYTLSDRFITHDLTTITSGTNLSDSSTLLQRNETVSLYGMPSLLSDLIIRDFSLTQDSTAALNATFYLRSDEKQQTALWRIDEKKDTIFFSSPNDTLRFSSPVGDYLAYDDGSAEFGYELKQRFATLAYEYELDTEDLLTAVDIYIPRLGQDLSNETFNLMVWQNISTTTNQANQVLLNGLSTTIAYTGINEFRRINLNQAIPLSKGKFYIGYQQISADLVPIGYDANTNSTPRIFTNTEGQWILDERNTGHLMLRPVFKLNSVITALNPQPKNISCKVYPNPAKNFLIIEGNFQESHLYDILGKKVLTKINVINEKEKIDISSLKQGVYFLKVSRGQDFKALKVIVK